MTPPREWASSGSPYEARIGFSRAVRDGRTIAVSGTAPVGPDGGTVGVGDAGAQARRCFAIIGEALEALGASLESVVRTRIFIIRVEDWEEVAAVHGGIFGEIRPASTIVRVAGFLDPEWLVEIEADAVADRGAHRRAHRVRGRLRDPRA